MKEYRNPEEAKEDQAYLQALKELLYQVADDDLLISHRGSEWLGLAPHIEEDVAYSSITQDTLGHALIHYQMLEELGEGKADDLAFLRSPDQYRHALLTERANGLGHYKENPTYDWAYAVVRNYVYEVFKRIRLDHLLTSSYKPLADTAAKIKQEQFYHLYHWEVWMDQLTHSTEEAKRRMEEALHQVWPDLATLYDLGPMEEAFHRFFLLDPDRDLKEDFLQALKEKVVQSGLPWLGESAPLKETGREGSHTEDFLSAWGEMGEVYRIAPEATW